MTAYLSFRSQNVGGGVVHPPRPMIGDGTADPPALRVAGAAELAALVAGKNVLFGVHGFNVSYDRGARSLGQLEPLLGLSASDVFIGVLWPGDFWIPVINYPFEGDTAMECGRYLADFCQRRLREAASFSFVSHSLGARLVLEAIDHLGRPARAVCLTAGAINRDCLVTEYAASAANAAAIAVLASHKDLVLKVAFQIGDPIADLLHEDHTPFEAALGYDGPRRSPPSPVAPPWQIPDQEGYEHGDYLPPGDRIEPAAGTKWQKVAGFMARSFRGLPPSWS
jgi:hypothetical protein